MKLSKRVFFGLSSALLLVASAFGFSIGRSAFVSEGNAFDTSTTIAGNKTNLIEDSKDTVKVTLKQAVYDYTNFDDLSWATFSGYSGSISSESDFNKLKDFLEQNTDSTVFKDNELAGAYTIKKGTYGTFSGLGQYKEYVFQLIVSTEIKKSLGFFKYNYSGKYTLEFKKTTLNCTEKNVGMISLPKGNNLLNAGLASNFELYNNSAYNFAGYKKELSGDYFDLTTMIDSDITLYGVFFKSGKDNIFNKYNVSDTINNFSPSSKNYQLEFWKGNSSDQKNIGKDYSYDSVTNTVYLSKEITIDKKNNTSPVIRFNMNDGNEHKSLEINGSSINIDPEDGKHELQYVVKLGADVHLKNGAFCIGGNFGTTSNVGTESHLVKEYVCLDLNGHDFYIESGGELWSYGLIKDSVGTGHIYVRGGTIKTLVTIMDYRGGDCTLNATKNNTFPFTSYALPYIRANIVFDYSNSVWGKLVAICHITPSKYSVNAKTELNFIGPEDGFLFKMNGGDKQSSKLLITPYNINKTGVADGMCVLRKLKLTMVNVSLYMKSIKMDLGKVGLSSISVDTSSYTFPMNPFFDVELKNSTMTFAQKIQFMTGFSFVADENSTIIFDKGNDRSAQLSVLDRPFNYWDNKSGSFITTDNGGVMGYSGSLNSNQQFWKYNSMPKIKLHGKLLFRKGNDGSDSSKIYRFVGPVDFNENKVGIIDADGNETLYDSSKGNDAFTFLKNNGVAIRTYGFDTMLGYYHSDSNSGDYHAKGYSRPLYSNGKAYVIDNNMSQANVGKFDSDTGIFTSTSDSKLYYFNNDANYSFGDDGNCSFKECGYDGKIITDSETQKKYIFFASMYGVYDSSTGKVDMSRILTDQYSKDVAVKYDGNKKKWLRG